MSNNNDVPYLKSEVYTYAVFFSLRHFGHLSQSCIKTRRNSVF